MKILHISDTHINGSKHFEENSLREILAEVEKERYDLIIHSGDVTQEGKENHYLKAKKIFSGIDIPMVVIPGNHDKRSGGISLFKDHIGDPNGVKETESGVVIYVDSGVLDSDIGRVGMTKYNMINRALKLHNDKDIKIIAMHHHTLPIPMAGRERNVLSNAGDLLELFLRYDVDLVLSGHRHYPNVYHVDGTVFVNAGTASGKKTRYGDVNSYNVIEIDEEKMKVTTHRIGENSDTDEKKYFRKEKRVFHDFGKRKFRLIHTSNSFISSSRKFKEKHFFNALNKINSLEGDVLVHCGGIVKEGIPKDYDVASAYMSKFDVPVVYSPAGRDINYLGYELFEEHFGEIDQKFRDKDIYLRGISSAQYDSPIGIIGETGRERLFTEFNEVDESFKGIFLHHNVLPIPHAREKGLLEDSGDFLRRAVDEKVDLILTGTSSHPFAARVGETVVVNANSLSSVYQSSLFGNSFNVIDVYEKVIVVSEINSLWGARRVLGIWERNNA